MDGREEVGGILLTDEVGETSLSGGEVRGTLLSADEVGGASLRGEIRSDGRRSVQMRS